MSLIYEKSGMIKYKSDHIPVVAVNHLQPSAATDLVLMLISPSCFIMLVGNADESRTTPLLRTCLSTSNFGRSKKGFITSSLEGRIAHLKDIRTIKVN